MRRSDVFASLLPRLAQGYALDALAAGEARQDADAAAAFLDEALGAPRMEVGTAGIGSAFAVGTPALVGSALTYDGELIQLSAFPVESGGAKPAGRIARPSRRRAR